MSKDKGSILLVEPDQHIASMAREALYFRGYKNLYFASSGMEALVKLRLAPDPNSTRTSLLNAPDFVITDSALPDMSGFDLCRQIKKNNPMSVVIVLLDHGIENVELSLVEARADDFMTKSLTSPAELVSRLEFMMDRKVAKNGKGEKAETGDYSLPHVGDKIGKYYIIDSLAWSKLSAIYRVYAPGSSEIYALKLLTPHAAEIEESIEHFKREIGIMSRLEHPNIIHFYETGEYHNCPFAVMDFINGLNLEKHLISRGLPSLDTVFSMAEQIASAAECLHAHGVIHRDIKLSNIMLTEKPLKATLADFGISRELERREREENISGTPIYMAPELFAGEPATPRSDIYSFGVTLYHFLTGVPPYTGEDIQELMKKHSMEPPKSMLFFRPEIPRELDAFLLEECMAKSPAKRPRSMKEMGERLAEIAVRYQARAAVAARPLALLVDDEPNILSALRRALIAEPYDIITADNGEEALAILEKRKVDLILTDARMPGIDGIELCRRAGTRWPDTARLILSGYSDIDAVVAAINDGHIYKFLRKPWNDEELKQSIRLALEQRALAERNLALTEIVSAQNRKLHELNEQLEAKIAEQTAALEAANGRLAKYFSGVVETFSGLMDARLPELTGHGKRVCRFAVRLAEAAGSPPEILDEIEIASFLHDIGMISSQTEFQAHYRPKELELLNRGHSLAGYRVLIEIPDFDGIALYVKHHHENYDGSGFPDQLAGEKIPFGARVIAIADAFDHIMRPAEGITIANRALAVDNLNALSGNRLDPKLTALFLEKAFTEVDFDYYRNRLPAHLLRPGMVLAADVMDEKGEIACKAGVELTREIIEVLAKIKLPDAPELKIAVTEKTSIPLPSRFSGQGKRQIDPSIRAMHQLPDNKFISISHRGKAVSKIDLSAKKSKR